MSGLDSDQIDPIDWDMSYRKRCRMSEESVFREDGLIIEYSSVFKKTLK